MTLCLITLNNFGNRTSAATTSLRYAFLFFVFFSVCALSGLSSCELDSGSEADSGLSPASYRLLSLRRNLTSMSRNFKSNVSPFPSCFKQLFIRVIRACDSTVSSLRLEGAPRCHCLRSSATPRCPALLTVGHQIGNTFAYRRNYSKAIRSQYLSCRPQTSSQLASKSQRGLGVLLLQPLQLLPSLVVLHTKRYRTDSRIKCFPSKKIRHCPPPGAPHRSH